MFNNAIRKLAVVAVVKAKQKGRMIAVAESCTGGLLAAAITDIAGSSAIFDRGLVTYSNAAKAQALGVDMSLIDEHGAVSDPVARAMVEGLVAHSDANLFCSITGIAGPGGGSDEKPIGTVFIGIGTRDGEVSAQRFEFPGDRTAVREKTVETALKMLVERI